MNGLSKAKEIYIKWKILTNHGSEVFIIGLTVFFLACIIGYYVVWSVTPALAQPINGSYKCYIKCNYCGWQY